MKKHYAVIGDPIEHSRSPELYAPMFEKAGIDADFLRLRVERGDIRRIREIVIEHSLSGFAVTMPHKKAILPFLNEADDAARSAGSVNIVTIEDGRLIGHNTDGAGLVNALLKSGTAVENRLAVILGNGGAAAGAKAALEREGAEVRIVSRKHTEAGPLPVEEAVFERERAERLFSRADILINATPLGMAGGVAFRDLSFVELLKKGCTVFDMVYRPDGEATALITAAKRCGHAAIGGERLLYHQGVIAFRLWTGRDPEAPDQAE